MAHYPYNSSTIRTTWQDFKTNYKPSINSPALPTGSTKWKFWQFTGDKFILPGCESLLDINYFNGELADLKKFVGNETTTPPINTTPTSLTIEERLAKLEAEARSHGWSV
jgi:hypothetical protein